MGWFKFLRREGFPHLKIERTEEETIVTGKWNWTELTYEEQVRQEAEYQLEREQFQSDVEFMKNKIIAEKAKK